MDIVIIGLVTLALLILTILFFINKSKNPVKAENEQPPERNVPRNTRNVNPARNRLRNRLQNRNANNQIRRNDNDDDDYNDNDDEDADLVPNRANNNAEDVDEDDEDRLDYADREKIRKKIGTKKLAKMEEKAARKERNEEMAREREERKAKEEKAYEERKKREEEEERLEKEKQEIERLAREEQEKKEYEEYLKLKEQFSVEEEGHDAPLSDLDSQNLLQKFVEFIKSSKIVVLEDLAAEFKLKTQDAINRITQVQEMGLLTGVMDDRGKFIYISEDELLMVKKFIEQRGRVNISELAKSSNQLINLKPTNDENLSIQSNEELVQ